MLPEDGSYASCSGCGRYGGWANSGEVDIMEIANTMQEVSAGLEQPTVEGRYGGMPHSHWLPPCPALPVNHPTDRFSISHCVMQLKGTLHFGGM